MSKTATPWWTDPSRYVVIASGAPEEVEATMSRIRHRQLVASAGQVLRDLDARPEPPRPDPRCQLVKEAMTPPETMSVEELFSSLRQ